MFLYDPLNNTLTSGAEISVDLSLIDSINLIPIYSLNKYISL